MLRRELSRFKRQTPMKVQGSILKRFRATIPDPIGIWNLNLNEICSLNLGEFTAQFVQ